MNAVAETPIKIRTQWMELETDTNGFHKQNPPLCRLAAASVSGLFVKLVQLELRRLDVTIIGEGQDDGVPFVTLQHTDDDQLVWETHVSFPQMKGYYIWTSSIYKDNAKIAFVKELP